MVRSSTKPLFVGLKTTAGIIDMAWWIQVLQIADDRGCGVGKYRLTAKSDEDGGGPYGLCEHRHDSREEAQNCPEASERAKGY